MVALLIAPAGGAQTPASTGGSGGVPALEEPAATPPAPSSGGTGRSPSTRSGRPVLTVFEATTAAALRTSTGGAAVRFQVRDAARRVRVRLAFIGQDGAGTKRFSLGRRRTGVVHSVRRSLAAGTYRVRIAAVNPRGRRAVRATTVQVTPAPAVTSDGVFPVQGAYDFGGAGSRFGASRTGHRHQGQDIAAAEGTPVVAPKSGTIHWRAYQAGGAGYYLVLDGDGEDFMYVFMHLRQGSLLVSKGDYVAAGQQIAQVGNTGSSSGPHLHFEIWDGVWFGGGDPIDPLPLLRAWEAAP